MCLAFSGAAVAEPAAWTVDMKTSRLGFTATQLGSPFEGAFKTFSASIRFDEKDLPASRVQVEIDMGSVDSQSPERDGAVVGAERFNVAEHPKSMFETVTFENLGGGKFTAKSRLTMRGVTKEVEFPFHLETRSDGGKRVAHMEGEITIDRRDFDIGQGQWAAATTVGADVVIKAVIRAHAPL